jgi:hypothetical protein
VARRELQRRRGTESLLKWSRSEPHRQWWKNSLRDSGGTGFWHETYLTCSGPACDHAAQDVCSGLT